MAEEVGVEPTRHLIDISTALKAARFTGNVALPRNHCSFDFVRSWAIVFYTYTGSATVLVSPRLIVA